MKKILLLLLTFSFAFQINAQSPLILSIKHKLGGEDYSPIAIATSLAGYEFTAKRVQYYISEIEIIHDGGQITQIPDVVILVDAAHDVIEHLGSPSIDNFEGISYTIGVEESLNHLDPTTYPNGHPLAPQNPNMHWGWASGYKFVAFEGNAGTSSLEYQIHALGDENYFKTTPEVYWYYQSQTSFAPIIIDIHADYVNAISGIDVSDGLIEHSAIDEAVDLLVNFRDKVFGPGDGSPLSNEDIISNNTLTIQPNPASSVVRIALDNYDGGDYSMKLIDITGKIVLSKNMQSRDQYLDVSQYTNGMYFVQLWKDNAVVEVQKLTIAN